MQNSKANMYALQVRWLANFIPTMFGALVMILAGFAVSRGMMAVSAYVAFVGAVNAFGPAASAIFMDIFNMAKV